MGGSRFKRLADKTTLHAVEDFYYSNAAGKIFWGTLAAVAVTILVFQLNKVVLSFYNQEIGATLTYFIPEEMPAVTICPDAWVNQSKIDKLDRNFTDKTVSVINGLFNILGMNQLFDIQEGTLNETIDFVFSEYRTDFTDKILPFWRDAANESIYTLVELIGMEGLDTALAETMPAKIPLVQNRVVTWNGVCYRFENDATVNELQSAYAGIKLIFEQEEALAVPYLKKKDGTVIQRDPHFRVYLSVEGQLDMVIRSEVFFNYGMQYALQYSVTKVKRLNRRKFPCKAYTTADHDHCVSSYVNKEAKGSGGGVDMHYQTNQSGSYHCETVTPKTDNLGEHKVKKPCNTFVDLNGSSTWKSINLQTDNVKLNEICPRPCEVTSYQYTYQERRRRWSSFGNVRNTPTLLDIKHSQQLGSTQTEEYLLMTTEGMLSSVGGTLGLWIGASVMSLIQVFYLVCLESCMKKRPVEEKNDTYKEQKAKRNPQTNQKG